MFIDRPMPGPRVRIAELKAAVRSAWAWLSRDKAIVASYRTLPPHVLSDIGLDPSDIDRAAQAPASVSRSLAESLGRRAHHLARRPLPPTQC